MCSFRAKGDEVPEHVGVLEVGLGVPLLRVDETVHAKRNGMKRNETERDETSKMKRVETKRKIQALLSNPQLMFFNYIIKTTLRDETTPTRTKAKAFCF